MYFNETWTQYTKFRCGYFDIIEHPSRDLRSHQMTSSLIQLSCLKTWVLSSRRENNLKLSQRSHINGTSWFMTSFFILWRHFFRIWPETHLARDQVDGVINVNLLCLYYWCKFQFDTIYGSWDIRMGVDFLSCSCCPRNWSINFIVWLYV